MPSLPELLDQLLILTELSKALGVRHVHTFENGFGTIHAKKGGKVLGALTYYPSQRGEVHVEGVAVHPEAQRAGIGQGLLGAFKKVALRHGYQTMTSNPTSQGSMRLVNSIFGSPVDSDGVKHLPLEGKTTSELDFPEGGTDGFLRHRLSKAHCLPTPKPRAESTILPEGTVADGKLKVKTQKGAQWRSGRRGMVRSNEAMVSGGRVGFPQSGMTKHEYRWTPELAQQQADDQTVGAFIQPHSWDAERGKRVFDVDPKKLKPTEELSYPGNVQKIVDHIKSGGALPPIYVDAKGKVLDGHHHLAASKQLRLKTVPTIRRTY